MRVGKFIYDKIRLSFRWRNYIKSMGVFKMKKTRLHILCRLLSQLACFPLRRPRSAMSLQSKGPVLSWAIPMSLPRLLMPMRMFPLAPSFAQVLVEQSLQLNILHIRQRSKAVFRAIFQRVKSSPRRFPPEFPTQSRPLPVPRTLTRIPSQMANTVICNG